MNGGNYRSFLENGNRISQEKQVYFNPESILVHPPEKVFPATVYYSKIFIVSFQSIFYDTAVSRFNQENQDGSVSGQFTL